METTAREGQPAQKKGESTGHCCVEGRVGVGVQDYGAQDTLLLMLPQSGGTNQEQNQGT